MSARAWADPDSAPSPAVVAMAHAARSRAETSDAPRAAIGVEPPPLVIRSLGRSRVVHPCDVGWIEAEGSYVKLHTEDGSHLLRRSLADLAAELAGEGFVRIHRSTVVRLDRIAELRRRSHGDASVVLKSGIELKVSRTYRGSLSSLGL